GPLARGALGSARCRRARRRGILPGRERFTESRREPEVGAGTPRVAAPVRAGEGAAAHADGARAAAGGAGGGDGAARARPGGAAGAAALGGASDGARAAGRTGRAAGAAGGADDGRAAGAA